MKTKFIIVLLIFVLSISTTACSSDKESSNLNNSSNPSSNKISNTSVPTNTSAPITTPSDSKIEDVKTPLPSENKIPTITVEKMYDILSTKNKDVIDSLNLSDSDNIKSLNDQGFYVPVFNCKRLGILIGFNGADFDPIDKVKEEDTTPIFIMPTNGTTISFDDNFSFRVGDDLEQFKAKFGKGNAGKEGNLKGDKEYSYLTYEINNLSIRFTSLDGDDFKKYDVYITKWMEETNFMR